MLQTLGFCYFVFVSFFLGLAFKKATNSNRLPSGEVAKLQLGSHWRCATHLFRCVLIGRPIQFCFLGDGSATKYYNHCFLAHPFPILPFLVGSTHVVFPFWGVLKWERLPQIIQLIRIFFCIETTKWWLGDFPMTWDPKNWQFTEASTILSRQVQRPVLSPPDQILGQMQRTADGDKLKIRSPWWDPKPSKKKVTNFEHGHKYGVTTCYNRNEAIIYSML